MRENKLLKVTFYNTDDERDYFIANLNCMSSRNGYDIVIGELLKPIMLANDQQFNDGELFQLRVILGDNDNRFDNNVYIADFKYTQDDGIVEVDGVEYHNREIPPIKYFQFKEERGQS